MSYDQTAFRCVEHGGGSTVPAKLWTYYTTDNLASLTIGTAYAGYFNSAVADTPNLVTGDVIMAVNGATPVVSLFVVSGVTASSVTIVPSAGAKSYL